jgi:hypothetical protein
MKNMPVSSEKPQEIGRMRSTEHRIRLSEEPSGRSRRIGLEKGIWWRSQTGKSWKRKSVPGEAEKRAKYARDSIGEVINSIGQFVKKRRVEIS